MVQSMIFKSNPRRRSGRGGEGLVRVRRPRVDRLWRLLLLSVLSLSQPALAEPTLAVHGTVRGIDGNPAVGIPVELTSHPSAYRVALLRLNGGQGEKPSASAVTGENGRFTLRVAEAGVYEVLVRPPKGVPLEYSPVPLVEKVELPPVKIQPAMNLPIRLRRSGRGGPPADIPVSIRTSSTSPVQSVFPGDRQTGWRIAARRGRTDRSGHLELPRAPGERLDVSIRLPGGSLPHRIQGVESLDQAIQISDPVEPEQIELEHADGSAAEGVVLLHARHGLPLTQTNERGVAPLNVLRLTDRSSLKVLALGRNGARHRIVVSRSDDGSFAPVALPEMRPLRGRVLSSTDEAPVGGALVWNDNDPGIETVTAKDGTFALARTTGLTGSFRVGIAARGYVALREEVPNTLRSDPENPHPRVPLFHLTPAGAIRGRIVDSNGKPVGHAVLKLEALRLRTGPAFADRPYEVPPHRGRTGPMGYFKLERLSPGQAYRLTVRKRGFEPARTEIVARLDSRRHSETLVLEPDVAAFGRIEDPEGSPISGARVQVRPAGTEDRKGSRSRSRHPEQARYESVTGDEGRFELQLVPSPPIDLEVTADGFPSLTVRGLDAAVEQGPGNLGTFHLEAGVSISGRIIEAADGRPIPGAKIWKSERRPRRPDEADPSSGVKPDAETGRDGRFRLNGLRREETAYLMVRADGYVSETVAGVRGGSGTPLEIALERGGSLTGRVVGPEGRAVSAAEITARPAQMPKGVVTPRATGHKAIHSTTSDSEGRFNLRQLEPAIYSVRAAAQNYAPSEPKTREVLTDRATRELELVLEPGASIHGIVRSTEGHPIDGASVTWSQAGAVTDEDGRFRLEGVSLGSRKLTVSHPGFEDERRVVGVSLGANRADFVLRPGLQVQGRVVEPSGTPVSGATVTLAGGGSLEDYHATSDASGAFEFGRVARGSYRVAARKDGYAPRRHPTPVAVANFPVTGLELTLRRGTVVFGQLLGLSREELRRVQVVARAAPHPGGQHKAPGSRTGAGITRRGRAGDDGRYEVCDLPEGTWRIRAYLPNGRRETSVRVEVGPQLPRRQRKDLEFDLGLRLTGTVLHSGLAVPEARVTLSRPREEPRATKTDMHGRFRLDDLQPGPYRVDVSHSRKLLTETRTIRLDGNRDVRIDITTARLVGRTFVPGRGPIQDALVIARRTMRAGGSGGLRTVATDAEGRFRFDQLPLGRYRIEVRSERTETLVREIEIEGDSSVLELALKVESTETPPD